MCIGKYGDIPKLPEFPSGKGPEIFAGKVMHSLDYCKLGKEEAIELLKGKRVAIIGYKKSAIDLAVECAQANQGIITFSSIELKKRSRDFKKYEKILQFITKRNLLCLSIPT